MLLFRIVTQRIIFVYPDDAAEACPVHGGVKKVSKQTGKSEKTPVWSTNILRPCSTM